MMRIIASYLAGVGFAMGLGVAGMTQPDKIRGFLDIFGKWDPTLVMVMASAVLTYGIAYSIIRHRPRPLLAPGFSIPANRHVDWRLVTGAAIFGVGWGLAGYCPGPGLALAGAGQADAVLFIVAMIGGWFAFDLLARVSAEVRKTYASGGSDNSGTQAKGGAT